MSRVRLARGVRYLLAGEVFCIRDVLPGDRLLVQSWAFGSEARVTRDELHAAWDRGELRFEVADPGIRRDCDAPVLTAHTIADLVLQL